MNKLSTRVDSDCSLKGSFDFWLNQVLNDPNFENQKCCKPLYDYKMSWVMMLNKDLPVMDFLSFAQQCMGIRLIHVDN